MHVNETTLVIQQPTGFFEGFRLPRLPRALRPSPIFIPFFVAAAAIAAMANYRHTLETRRAERTVVRIAELEPVVVAPVAFSFDTPLALPATFRGTSGRLKAMILEPREPVPGEILPFESPIFETPGIYRLTTTAADPAFSVIRLRPFSDKIGGRVGSYMVGYWKGEWQNVRPGNERPDGFIEVTRENQDIYVSQHLRLRDFITHDQANVWPKYVVLRESLLDKIELVLDDLSSRGIATSRVVVRSGFRTPQYNEALGDASGRARESRHQYGDAADLLIDSNFDGRMDDLDRDGRVGAGDVRVIAAAVERVELKHPELLGGLGLYDASHASGVFAHIDVRGYRARWHREAAVRAARPATARAGLLTVSSRATGRGMGTCFATGASAVLCRGGR
jgi:hypothetical protein